MHIEPAVPDFKYVRIIKSGGFAGVMQSITLDQGLNADVNCGRTGNRKFTLDAHSSQELMNALATTLARKPMASTAQGCDLFEYDIEIAWGTNVYRVHSVDLGADEALLGVMYAANKLIECSAPEDAHIMSVRDTPHVDGQPVLV